MSRQVLGDTRCGSLHSGLALAPASRADFAMFFRELQSIDHPQHFVDVPSEGQVVDHLMTDNTLLVDQE